LETLGSVPSDQERILSELGDVEFTPVTAAKNRRLADAVAEHIAFDIRRGDFPPGHRLPPERVLARRFGVSRSVIREALFLLKQAGLVHTRQGAGTYVISAGADPLLSPDLDAEAPAFKGRRRSTGAMDSAVLKERWAISHGSPQLTWLFELRLGLESEIAAFAALRADLVHKQKLLEALHALKNASAEPAKAVAADRDFHLAVARMTGNRYFVNTLTKVLAALEQPMALSRLRSVAEPELERGIWQEHAAVYKHIVEQDPDGARDAMREHLNAAYTRLTGTVLYNSD